MNKWIWIASLTGLVFLTSLIMNLVFYDFWQQEKEKASEYQKELKETQLTLETVKENKENNVLTDSEAFINEMFTYNSDESRDVSKRLSELMTDEGKVKLLGSGENANMERSVLSGKGVTSSIKIQDSQYNKISPESAKATITFERTLVSSGETVKQVYEVILTMKYERKKWLVDDFEISELI